MTGDKQELKPCPWCGGRIKRPTAENVSSIGPKNWWVRFYHDGVACIGRLTFEVRASAKTKEEAISIAIRAWNRRADERSKVLRKVREEMEWAIPYLEATLRHLRSRNDPMALAFANGLSEFKHKALLGPEPGSGEEKP